MKFAHFFIDRPIFAAVLSIIVFTAGLIAIPSLPISEYPEVAPPSVVVRTVYPGANPQVIASPSGSSTSPRADASSAPSTRTRASRRRDGAHRADPPVGPRRDDPGTLASQTLTSPTSGPRDRAPAPVPPPHGPPRPSRHHPDHH